MPSRGPSTHVTNRQMSSLLLNWNEIYSWDAHGIVVGYMIFYRPYYSNQAFTVVQTNASTFNIKLNNLQGATLYAIMVAGLTSKGEGRQRISSASTCKYSLLFSHFPPPSLPYSFAPSSSPLPPLFVFVFVSVCLCLY